MLIDADSGTVRTILRTYFIIMFPLLGIAINLCGGYLLKLKLLDGRPVNVTLMTGWIGGLHSVMRVVARLRRVPGGWMGYFMILSGVLSEVSDLAVSALVKTDFVPSRCPFGEGLVIPSTAQNLGAGDPPVNGAPYYVVAQAQLTSQSNGGPVGIYWKVNRDTTFRADSQDLIGSWLCAELQPDVTYPPATPSTTVVTDLQQNGLQYSSSTSMNSEFPNGSYSHLVVWSSSIGNEMGTPFDIRASRDLSASAASPKIMRNYLCKMNADEVEWILSGINSSLALQQWSPGFQGNMYDGTGTPAANDTGGILERYLNSMVMVAGGYNFLLSTSTENTQGCLVPQTSVPLPVIILFSLVGVMTSLFTASAMGIWIWLRSRIRQLQSLHDDCNTTYYEDIDKHIPNNLVSWIAQAARESAIRESYIEGRNGREVINIKQENLATWEYGPSHNSVNAVLRRGGVESRDRWRATAVPAGEYELLPNAGGRDHNIP